jgi:hypothetical protein
VARLDLVLLLIALVVYEGWEVHHMDVKYRTRGAYAMKILERSCMTGCNSCHVTMDARLKLSKQSTQPLVDTTAYRSIVGSLRYLVNTHPDLAFVVGYVSHFLEEQREDHLAAVKKILHYVAGTCN